MRKGLVILIIVFACLFTSYISRNKENDKVTELMTRHTSTVYVKKGMGIDACCRAAGWRSESTVNLYSLREAVVKINHLDNYCLQEGMSLEIPNPSEDKLKGSPKYAKKSRLALKR